LKAQTVPSLPPGFSEPIAFRAVSWSSVPEEAGVYAIYDQDELLYSAWQVAMGRVVSGVD
jgi:hypothetical protein